MTTGVHLMNKSVHFLQIGTTWKGWTAWTPRPAWRDSKYILSLHKRRYSDRHEINPTIKKQTKKKAQSWSLHWFEWASRQFYSILEMHHHLDKAQRAVSSSKNPHINALYDTFRFCYPNDDILVIRMFMVLDLLLKRTLCRHPICGWITVINMLRGSQAHQHMLHCRNCISRFFFTESRRISVSTK